VKNILTRFLNLTNLLSVNHYQILCENEHTMMKILIAFYTSTGNTKRIALSMKKVLENYDIDLLEIDDYESRDLSGYDLIILGSGVYLGVVGDKLIELVRNALNFPPKYACFYSCQSKEPYHNCFKPIKEAAEQKGSKYLGEFHCLGEPFNYYSGEEYVEAQKKFDELGFHPDKKDLENAKQFILDIIKQV